MEGSLATDAGIDGALGLVLFVSSGLGPKDGWPAMKIEADLKELTLWVSLTEIEPNPPFHLTAALLRFEINPKGRVWAARGDRER